MLYLYLRGIELCSYLDDLALWILLIEYEIDHPDVYFIIEPDVVFYSPSWSLSVKFTEIGFLVSWLAD